jgi:hypothetical protein
MTRCQSFVALGPNQGMHCDLAPEHADLHRVLTPAEFNELDAPAPEACPPAVTIEGNVENVTVTR